MIKLLPFSAMLLAAASFFGSATAQEVLVHSLQGSAVDPSEQHVDGLGNAFSTQSASTVECALTSPRSRLRESGVALSGNTTHFGFGVAGGIDRSAPSPLGQGDVFLYTGRNQYDAVLDLEKLVGLPEGSFLIRFEHWYGEFGNVSLRTGSFAPSVMATELPPVADGEGVPYLTNLAWTQPLSDRLAVFAGKMSAIGGAEPDVFAGGDGTDGFTNMNLVVNPALLLGMPYSAFNVGIIHTRDWGTFTTYVIDPTDRTTEFLRVDDWFSRGIIVGEEVRLNARFLNRRVQHQFGGVWKHVPLTDLSFDEPPPGVFPEPVVPGVPTLNNSYTLYYGFDQHLVEFPDGEKGWGVFGRTSISDGNPTPVWYFFSAGIGGDSPLRRSAGDTFGVGWYFVGASNEFGPVPRATYGPRNGTGVEMFYNFQVTPRLNVTPDLQFLHPEASAIADDSIVYGVRVGAKF